MTTAVQERRNVAPMPTEERIEASIVHMRDKFAAVLPPHVPADRFVRSCLAAISKPDLAKVRATDDGRRSVYEACLKAATDGLLVDGREAALVRYNAKIKDEDGKDKWVDVAQYMPMVAGLMKKARNSGEIASIIAQVVCANDEFTIDYVTDGAPITHRPNIADRGPAVGVYAIARLKDGSWSQPEFMTFEEVGRVRARSKAKDSGPWVSDFNEMARKTVIRRASKYWPSSTDRDGADFSEIVARDDALIDLVASDVTEQRTIAAPKQRSAAKLIEQALANEARSADHDAETGEAREEADA